MTEKRCCDCKYTRGIGYDFWCGEGHTEYEVFLGETNCPYYEYHDWSKGTPSRTEKRFECNENKVIDNCINGVTECKNSNEAYLLCNFLNEQHEEIQDQKRQLDECQIKKQKIKELMLNAEAVVEQKKLQKLIYRIVIDLIDEKIKELPTTSKYGDIHEDLRIFAQQVLYDLKKELQE